MKNKILMLLLALAAPAAVLGYAVDFTQTQFKFEFDEDNVYFVSDMGVGHVFDCFEKIYDASDTALWSGKSLDYAIRITEPGVAAYAWGTSSDNINGQTNWVCNQSTNITLSYDANFRYSTMYLYVWLKWMRYDIQFLANGGSAVTNDFSDICYTNSVALPESERPGYNFSGWTNETFTTAITGSKKGVDLGVNDDGTNITLFAAWEPQTFTVTFDPGEGATVSPSTKSVTYDSPYGALPTATRPSSAFVGWFTEANAGYQISNETVVAITADQTLYAHWSELYAVTFQSEGGSIYAVSNDLAYGATVVPPSIEVPEGKRFKGWEYGSTIYPAGANITVSQNMTLTSVFESMKTDVTYSWEPSDGGNVQITGEKYGDYGRSVTLIATPKGDKFSFARWSDGETDATRVISVIADTNLVAHFAVRSFAVAFFDLDGTTSLEAPQRVEYGKAATAPDAPLHEGLSFIGWSADFSSVTNDMSIVAQYETNRYTVVYDANGGSGVMTNDVFFYGMEHALQSNAYTRALYNFCGWASRPDVATNEVKYIDGATVSNLTAVANGTNTLYAIWQSVLSSYSVAADCTNLILACEQANQKWLIDYSGGYSSTSSVYAVGNSVARMTATLPGTGTLTFKARCQKINAAPNSGDIFSVQIDSTSLVAVKESTDWVSYSYSSTSSSSKLLKWVYAGYENDDKCWIDQVHWYPGRFVTVDSNKVTDDEKNAIMDAVLSRWDSILGVSASSISRVVATGPAVTNAVALLQRGVLPDVDASASPVTLTFTEKDLAFSISEFVMTNLPTAYLEVTVTSSSDNAPNLGIWGAPTLTSAWSRVEATGNSSRYAEESVISFEFDVTTNRFFKVEDR